ncbi:MAG: CPBP family intramembrane metalloprotease, partial [Gemmatimonadetes bacterium]|nr:CPBP family intramembrane metalloprotease [Gemmatimonadota bacterium]
GRYPYLLAAGAWIGALTLAAAWSLLVAWTGPEWLHLPDSAGRLTAQFGRNTAGLLIVVVVWGPLGEEVFFRGFLLPGIAGRLGAPAAVVISSALFAGFHVDPGAFAPTLLLGAALAWIYLRTGSIWPGVVAHGAQNALALWLAGAS